MIGELIQLILVWFGIYLIVNLSLNMEFGNGGIPNFGRHFAVIIGAITLGGIVNRLLMLVFGVHGNIIDASTEVSAKANEVIAQHPIYGLGLLIFTLALAFIVGFLTGLVFILPSAKLKEDYLGVTLLAIGEVMFFVTYYTPSLIGGYYGASVPDILAFIPGEQRNLVFVAIILAIALLVYFFVERLINTPYGRLIRAMRENENVVIAFGRDIMKVRMKTVALGSGIAAMAGALFGFYSANIISSAFTRVEWTFYPFLMILLGGKGNNRGVVLGTFAFILMKVLIEAYKFQIKAFLHLPFEAVWLEYILFGILALIVIYYKPEGILREEPIVTEPIKKLKKAKA
ncbi:branched-chain amino acid ABC transporter permease [Thermococcus sp. M39]|uniref:ABC transporter permease subunit n=1 Tax=unclassified Thermococcus TaxID=2627626 RepID=UPI00143A8CC6|nr:branched-chain amino acid ABC transporter permease [Thermococcus sp. M39]NJE13080.1 branched-chain amino acid ABC transporter permease [Thermococcus sp. LS2]